MTVIQNKWIEKERKKKSSAPDKKPVSSEPTPCHLNVSLATRSRTLRGVRK